MSNSKASVYLITGAARGLGSNISKQLLAQPGNTVVAVVRDAKSNNVKALQSFNQRAQSSKLIVLQVNGIAKGVYREAIKELEDKHQIDHIDVVIANAGINNSKESVYASGAEDIIEAINVNTIAPLQLFQATRQLLLNAKHTYNVLPKFVVLSSQAGSLAAVGAFPLSNVSYSISKAALNVVCIRIAYEEKDIVTLMVHPGLVDTPMVEEFFEKRPGLKAKLNLTPTDPQTAANSLLEEVIKATQQDSGRFLDTISGETIPW